MGKGFRHVDATEVRLVLNMVKEGIQWSTIQKVTGRSSIFFIARFRIPVCVPWEKKQTTPAVEALEAKLDVLPCKKAPGEGGESEFASYLRIIQCPDSALTVP